MKTRRSGNKLVLTLNKKTIAHLDHREMVKLKGREIGGLQQDYDEDLLLGSETDICGCPAPIDSDTLRLSIIKVLCNQYQ